MAFILEASVNIPNCSGSVPLKLGLRPGAYLVKEDFTTSTLENELYFVDSNLEFGKFNAWLNSLYWEIFILNGINDKIMKIRIKE